MDIKMIGLDLDGTLLDSNKRISDTNKEAIIQVMKKGVKVVICTGRILATSKMYAGLSGADEIIITCNGGEVINLKTKEYLNNETISMDSVERIINILYDHNVYFHVYIDNSLITERMELDALVFKNANDKVPEEFRLNIEVVDSVWDYIKEGNKKVSKFVAASEDIEFLNKVRQEVSYVPEIELASSNIKNFEVMKDGVSKGKGIKIAANHYGISTDEVMVIGDNENDISMLSEAGLPIVMNNAEDKIKNFGRYVTKSNDEDGVAHAIRKYIL